MRNIFIAITLFLSLDSSASTSTSQFAGKYKLVKANDSENNPCDGILEVAASPEGVRANYYRFFAAEEGCIKSNPGSASSEMTDCTRFSEYQIKNYKSEVTLAGYLRISHILKLNKSKDHITFQRNSTAIPLGIIPFDKGDYECVYKRLKTVYN